MTSLSQLSKWFKRRSGNAQHADQPSSPIPVATSPAATDESLAYTPVAGSVNGWLRVLNAQQLLRTVQADKALAEIWRVSRLSSIVWQRDLLPAIQRYAEFVQLMPASEAHHHAHAGGLLAHTIEMLLASMTWRNGYLLPSGEPIELIDAQRDEWTYVVFFAALLHDIAKPLTDLRVLWRSKGMADPLRWVPMAGPLNQITEGRNAPEYLVDFTPKAQRDYTAHSRLALLLLPRIAPASALSFLSMQPRAFEALNQYLSGLDHDSLVADLVRKADRASTEKSLLSGSRARFGTASAVPLVDLLMQALGAMLRAGTTLPLNRSGAAGWVYDGSMWFVAKRVADAVRTWIKTHKPDEAVPGEAKNDRLFDTWQEYGCILPNPQTGQAIWWVTVHGTGSETDKRGGEGEAAAKQDDPGAYSHSLSMLRFPLDKLFDDAAGFPPSMRGHIDVLSKRKQDGEVDTVEAAADVPDKRQEAAAVSAGMAQDAAPVPGTAGNPLIPEPLGNKQYKPKSAPTIRPPTFNKPKSDAKPKSQAIAEGAALEKPQPTAADPKLQQSQPKPSLDATSAKAAPQWLDGDDDVAAAQPKKSRIMNVPVAAPPVQVPVPATQQALTAQFAPVVPRITRSLPQIEPQIHARAVTPLTPSTLKHDTTDASTLPEPVVLLPKLPKLPKDNAAKLVVEPSRLAIEFMQWVQRSLVNRELKYNETGAAIHFTTEGLALVSPIIFKLYAHEIVGHDQADAHGLQVQREVIKAGWHMMGPNKTNIVRYEVIGRGGASLSKLSAVVLIEPGKWVQPVPPSNPVLRIA